MMIVAAAVAAAILGTTLACLNTGVRVTYAISRDTEVPQPLGKLNPRYGTPAIGVWVLTMVSALIGAFGVLSLTNLTAVMLLSNFGTFLVYGVTCIVAVLALSKERRSILTKYIVPIAGFAANMLMLVVVIWLGVVGGGATQQAALIAIVDYRHMDGNRLCLLLCKLKKQGIRNLSVPRQRRKIRTQNTASKRARRIS